MKFQIKTKSTGIFSDTPKVTLVFSDIDYGTGERCLWSIQNAVNFPVSDIKLAQFKCEVQFLF